MSNIDKRATELLIENGMLVADTLRHLADNEIDSDYFAICHTNENGTEIECELAITDYARQAAGTVDELVKALEVAENLNAELMDKQRLIDICQGQGLEHRIAAEKRAEAAEERIAELEARQPYGYLRENDGQIQISIGSNRPHDRSGGCATPWFAIYTAAGTAKGE